MKKLTIFLLILSYFTFAEDYILNQYNGFRNIEWATHIKKIKKLNLEYKSEGKKFLNSKIYIAENLKPTFGRAKIISNNYIFINNKLASVNLFFDSADANVVKKLLTDKFGKPAINENSSSEFSVKNFNMLWCGEKTIVLFFSNYGFCQCSFISSIAGEYDIKQKNTMDVKATKTDF